MLGKSFLTVERKEENGNWTIVATDADWHTKYVGTCNLMT